MKTFECTVRLEFGGNQFEAKNKKDYIKKVKESFIEEFGITLDDSEIINIKGE